MLVLKTQHCLLQWGIEPCYEPDKIIKRIKNRGYLVCLKFISVTVLSFLSSRVSTSIPQKMLEDDVGSLQIHPLTPELLQQAMEKVNEDPKRREADVQAIRDWLKKQPHIIADPCDQLIVNYFRDCKFSLLKTKQKLDMF